MKLSNYTTTEFIKCVLAGKPGRAKTAAGFTFPLPLKVFNFDGDSKLEGPIRFAKKMNIDINQIDVVSPSEWNYDWIKFDEQLIAFKKSPSPFKSFGFDSLTSIGDSLLGYTSNAKLRIDPNKVKKTGGIQVAGIDEYNAETSGLMDIILFMKDVNAHVWLSAHIIETLKQNLETGNSTKETSLLSGGKKAAARIPAYFPECYKLEKENPISSSGNVEFIFETRSPDDDYARTNYDHLPKKLNFTNKKFFDVLIEAIRAA